MELRDMRRPDVSIAFGSIVVVMTLFSWATVIQAPTMSRTNPSGGLVPFHK
jgi:hypothetical protein